MKEDMPFESIQFKSKDGLPITADQYLIEKPSGLILLCHRSHFNRGEFRDTALKFNELGFSCLAIDQRSGMNTMGVVNETKMQAKHQGLPTGYLNAKQDIEAAIDFCYSLNDNNPIILLGSSYSASLALLLSTETDKIKAILAFSPGEYLKGIHLAESIKTLDKPTFVTSSMKEMEEVTNIVKRVDPKYVMQFKPRVEGVHGSKALWESVEGNEDCWQAVEQFLSGK